MWSVWKDTTLVLEEVMRVEKADIRDNDHGGAVIEIALHSQSSGQSFMLPVDPNYAYQLLCLFQVEFLQRAVGKPVVVLRDEPYGYIKGLRSLPCDDPREVMR